MANTLEDDFLDDLDELEEVVQEEEAAAAALATRPSSSSSTSQNIREVGKGNGTQNVDPSESNLNSATAEAAGKTTRLLHSAKFQRLLERTSGDRSGGQSPTSSSSPSLGSLSNEELYQLVVETNEMLVSSQHELSEIHSRVAAAYDPKFPELRNLVGDNPLDFARVVRIIGNEMDVTTLEDKLAEVLPPSKVMVVSVTGSTTAGRVSGVVSSLSIPLYLFSFNERIIFFVVVLFLFLPNFTLYPPTKSEQLPSTLFSPFSSFSLFFSFSLSLSLSLSWSLSSSLVLSLFTCIFSSSSPSPSLLHRSPTVLRNVMLC